jgi:hypothetical protein
VSLADAKAAAAQHRAALASGIEPVGKRAAAAVKAANDGTATTFGAVADQVIEARRPSWRSAVHARQWEQSLKDHAAALKDMEVAVIDTEAVLAVLKPIWQDKRETADRLRNRVEAVLDYAVAKKLRPDTPNPARWRGHLAHCCLNSRRSRRPTTKRCRMKPLAPSWSGFGLVAA